MNMIQISTSVTISEHIMKWITIQHSKLDRITHSLLMKNFIHKDFEFYFLQHIK
jgi:hypothetical protein